MFPRLLRFSLAALVAFVLSSCGGGDSRRDNGSLNADELRLASLVIEGFDLVPAFSSDQLGPYRLEVDSSVESLTVSATPLDADNTSMTISASSLTEALSPAAGESVTIGLNQGENILVVNVFNSRNVQRATYQIFVTRESSEAYLQFFNYDQASSQFLSNASPAAFNRDVLEYSIDATYSVCSIGIQARANVRHSLLRLNGQAVEQGALSYVEIAEGANVLEMEVESQDGSETRTYQFTINRAAGAGDAVETDPRLANLTVSGTQLVAAGDRGFHCGISTYTARVNNNQSTIDITATPLGSSDSVFMGPIAQTTTGDYLFSGTVTEVNAGEAFSFDLDEGLNEIGLAVATEELIASPTYRIAVTRSATNWVEVSNGAELQAALQNAQPNDEIVLAAGEYAGASDAMSSGMDGVHFYAAASGTADENITLRGSSAILTGDNDTTVLQLSGDYWRVIGLRVQDGGTGVVLDGASNNLFESTNILRMQHRGLVLRNGSSSNSFQRVGIRDTGLAGVIESGEGLVVGVDDSQWQSAPDAGPYLPESDNNLFSNMKIGPGVSAELVEFKEGVAGNVLQFSSLDARESSAAAIRVGANDTQIRFNELLDAANVDQFVRVEAELSEWNSASWAQNSFVLSNRIDDLGATIVDLSSGGTEVSDNVDFDGAALSAGAGTTAVAIPSFAIQGISDDDQCLLIETVAVNAGTEEDPDFREFDVGFFDDCDGGADQAWTLVNRGFGEIEILSVDQARLAPLSTDFVTRSREVGLYGADSNLHPEAFMARWQVTVVRGNELQLVNKHYPLAVLTRSGVSDLYDNGLEVAMTVLNLNTSAQRFRFVQQGE